MQLSCMQPSCIGTVTGDDIGVNGNDKGSIQQPTQPPQEATGETRGRIEPMDAMSRLLDALVELLGDSSNQTGDEVRVELIAEGIDVDSSVARLMDTVRRCIRDGQVVGEELDGGGW